MVVCAAVKCSNSSRIKQMRFFKFPSEEARRKVWMNNSALQNEPGSYAKLCEIHFEESQFELHRQDGWKKLKPNAVPTVFPEPAEPTKRTREKSAPCKRKRSPSVDSEEDEERIPKKKKPKKRKQSLVNQESNQTSGKRKSSRMKNCSKPSGESSQSSQKENVSPRRRKGRPRKLCTPKPESSSETEVDESEVEEKNEQEKEISVLKRENESMRQEIQEFEKHNKSMSRVIIELEKHNKAMSVKLQELDKDNKVMSKKMQDLEKQNEDLKSKLNCCFSEEQFARMEKLMALGKIERYIPGIK